MSAIAIRPERAGDEAAIHALTEAAFRRVPYSDGSDPASSTDCAPMAIWRCRWWRRMPGGSPAI
ncbi:MAG: hypothetical protein WC692_03120 [Erythrobacter sp.]|jgi:hypothetical protein